MRRGVRREKCNKKRGGGEEGITMFRYANKCKVAQRTFLGYIKGLESTERNCCSKDIVH